MSEKRFKLDFDNHSQGSIMDRQDKYGQYCRLYDFGEVGRQQIVDLLNEQQDKITELEKNFEDLVNWSTEISKRNVLLDEKIGKLQQEEKLYAQEILRLNTLLKQYQANQDLGGGY